MQDRQINNFRILSELIQYSLLHPDLRFIQILWNLKVIDRNDDLEIKDRFYEEPEETLNRLMEVIHGGNKTSEKDKKVV